MAVDPVCYSFVDEESGKYITTFKGQKYYFCTASCKKKFEENPDKYARLISSIKVDPGASC
jgi:YHS domain-containing protein